MQGVTRCEKSEYDWEAVKFTDSRLRSADCPLLPAYCCLPTAVCLLPTFFQSAFNALAGFAIDAFIDS